LELAGKKNAGEMCASEIDWSRLDQLRIRDFLWIAEGDTLAGADQLDLQVQLGRLIRREMAVDHLLVEGLSADLPLIREHLPPAAEPQVDRPPAVFPPDFKAMAPPIDLRDFSICGGDIRIDEKTEIDSLATDGSLNLSTSGPSLLALDHLSVSDAAGRWDLESLTLKGDLDSLSLEGALLARLSETQIRWDFAIEVTDTILLACSPIVLEADDDHVTEPAEPRDLDGLLAFDPTDSTLDVQNLRLTGDLGEVRFDATLDRTRHLRARLDCEWLESPVPGLLAILPAFEVRSFPDSTLSAVWPSGEKVHLEVETDLQPSANLRALRGRMQLDFSLPGPRHLAPLFPPQLDLEVDDLGLIQGRLRADVDLDLEELEGSLGNRAGTEVPDLSGQILDLTLDLNPTEWLDTFSLRLRAEQGRLFVDTLHLALPGMRFDLAGNVRAESIDLRGELEIPDRQLYGRLGAATRDVDLTFGATFEATGRLSNPLIGLEGRGRALLPDVLIPRYVVSLEQDAGGRHLLLRAPEGLVAGSTSWALIELNATLPADTLAAFPLRAEFRADGERGGVELRTEVAASAAPDRHATFAVDVGHLALRFDEQTLQTSRPFSLLLDPGAGEMRLRDLDLTGDLGTVRAGGTVGADTMALTARLDLSLPPDLLATLLPEPYRRRDFGLSLQVDANAGGRPDSPFGSVAVSATASPQSEPGDLFLEGHARILPDGTAQTAGAQAAFSLSRADSLLVTGTMNLPGAWSSEPAGWAPHPSSATECELEAPGFDLATLNLILPDDLELEGRCRFRLNAGGHLTELIPFAGDSAAPGALPAPTPDFDLSGDLQLTEVKATVDSRSWLAAHCNATVGGTTRAPVVRGRMETISGVIELPPASPRLHPTEGVSLLWEDEARQPPASVAAGDSAAPAAGQPTSRIAPALDLDFEIVVPGEVWLRGPGLEAELGADLKIESSPETAAKAPVVASGTAQALQGSYKFMGRQFNVERGLVTLYGQAEPNPDLDVVLRTEVEDTIVRILVTGTAKEPQVMLSSEPEMSEGDILTLLVTSGGAGSGDASASALLVGLGLSQLQRRAAERIGLDTIEYRQSTAEGEASSLAVGKYLSPKLLIRYEQSLGEASAFLVKLNYLLSRQLKLETSYEAGGNSGIEVFWTRED